MKKLKAWGCDLLKVTIRMFSGRVRLVVQSKKELVPGQHSLATVIRHQ